MHWCTWSWLLSAVPSLAAGPVLADSGLIFNTTSALDVRDTLGTRDLDGADDQFFSPTDERCAPSHDTPEQILNRHAAPNRMQPSYFVYLGDVRPPRQIRHMGGFRPHGRDWESDELAYILERHYVAAPFGHGLEDRPRWHADDGRFRTAYVSVVRSRGDADVVYSGRTAPAWLYEIRATPNILDLMEWSSHCFALGGVPWHQVRRFRQNQPGARWLFNNDYDVEVFDAPESQSRLHTTCIDPGRPEVFDDTFPRILVDGIADPDRAYREGDLMRAAGQWVISRAHRHLTEPQFPFAWIEYADDASVPGAPLAQENGEAESRLVPAMTDSHRFMLSSALFDASLTVMAAMAVDDGIVIPLPRSWPERVERAGCSYWTSLTSGLDRGDDSKPHGAAKRDTKNESGNLLECVGLYMKAREWLLKNFGDEGPASLNATVADSPLLANETELLLDGQYGMLNCEDLLGKIVFYQATLGGGGNAVPHVPRLANNRDYCDSVLSEIRGRGKHSHAPHRKPIRPTPVDVVFFGHFLWPKEAKRQGGFLPPGQQAHRAQSGKTTTTGVNSPWTNLVLKASTTFGRAAKRAARLAAVETPGHSGIVYAVHATPNIVSLGSRAAIVGGIRWDQVLGWRRLPEDWERIAPRLDQSRRDELEQRFREALAANHSLMTPNADYDHKYDRFKTSVRVIQDMLDVDNDVAAFMQQHGQAVGWTGRFPLFNATVITGSESATAKAEALVANPHPEGEWAAFKEFVSNHRVAIASWVAIGALAMATGGLAGLGAGAGEGISVVGEGVIDGIASLFSSSLSSSSTSELAGLMEQGAQNIELEEAASWRMSDAGQGLSKLIKGAHQD